MSDCHKASDTTLDGTAPVLRRGTSPPWGPDIPVGNTQIPQDLGVLFFGRPSAT